MSNQQLQQLTQQVNGASDVLTAISETLPERPSRAKLRSQLESVLAVLQSVSRQLNAEIGRTVETHTTSSVGNAQGVSA